MHNLKFITRLVRNISMRMQIKVVQVHLCCGKIITILEHINYHTTDAASSRVLKYNLGLRK